MSGPGILATIEDLVEYCTQASAETTGDALEFERYTRVDDQTRRELKMAAVGWVCAAVIAASVFFNL